MKSVLKRHAKPPEERVDQWTAIEVFKRDQGCIAARYTPRHTCQARLTIGHVPCAGRNSLGKKAPPTREHLVSICLGASNEYWEERNRDVERTHLASFYPDYHVDGRCPALDD